MLKALIFVGMGCPMGNLVSLITFCVSDVFRQQGPKQRVLLKRWVASTS